MNINNATESFLAYSKYTRNLSSLTIKAYKQDLSILVQSTGNNTHVNNIDRTKIRNCIDELFANGQSNATVKRRLACFKSFFKWLENEELLEHSPFHRLDLKVRLPHRLPRNLGSDELIRMLEATKEKIGFDPHADKFKHHSFQGFISKKNLNYLTLLLGLDLLLTTGLRISELTNIELSDINIAEQYFHIKGKGQRERRVFITNQNIVNLIQQYKSIRSSFTTNHETFLINKLGKPATAQTIRLWMSKISRLNYNSKARLHYLLALQSAFFYTIN